jgi:hypothetical protein
MIVIIKVDCTKGFGIILGYQSTMEYFYSTNLAYNLIANKDYMEKCTFSKKRDFLKRQYVYFHLTRALELISLSSHVHFTFYTLYKFSTYSKKQLNVISRLMFSSG